MRSRWNGLWSSGRPWNAGNAAATAEWGRALVSGAHGGQWLPAVGSSGTHLQGQIAVPHTVVLAGRLTAGSRSAGIGERLEASGEAVTVCVVVGGVPSGTVSFHTGHGTVCRVPVVARHPALRYSHSTKLLVE